MESVLVCASHWMALVVQVSFVRLYLLWYFYSAKILENL